MQYTKKVPRKKVPWGRTQALPVANNRNRWYNSFSERKDLRCYHHVTIMSIARDDCVNEVNKEDEMRLLYALIVCFLFLPCGQLFYR